MKRGFVIFAALACTAITGCTVFAENTVPEPAPIDMSAWQYEASDDVYWQTGLSYAATPAEESYETMGIFVPGAYFNATDNGDGTYSCTVNEDGQAGQYTSVTAPFILPVNTPGYSAMSAPTDYSSSMGYGSISDYTNAGIIVLFAGARGRDAGAPAGVTDFKAAIRYARSNAEELPGDMDSIFSLGMSGGGAQSALIGSTGDSALYDPYLEAIGAVMDTSDAVKGSMCWCPITNLDQADEAYEWNMGNTRLGLSEEEQGYSDGMAEAFAAYINSLGLTDKDGTVLTLEESAEGIYQNGTYYDYIKEIIETSLEHFLEDNAFPYTASSGMGGGRGGFGGGNFGGQKPDGGRGGFGGGQPNGEMPRGDFGGELPDGELPDGNFGGELPDGEMPDGNFGGDIPDGELPDGNFGGELPDGDFDGEMQGGEKADEASYEEMDGIARTESTSTALSLSGTYETKQDYIDALNANGEWVSWDEETGEVTITSVSAFTAALKNASKGIAAFDQLDRSQGENTLFGYGDGNGAHFDTVLAGLVAGSDYEQDFADDLSTEDVVGNTVDVRLNMYTPLYYLCETYEGYQTAGIAQFWRIRTGINQGDTALCTEANLALALENYSDDIRVDFETVWGQGHTQAERTDSSTENFIAWVNACMNQ